MKISLNWLKEYIDLSGISSEEISERLTMTGLEVEEMVDEEKIYSSFIVGYVKEKTKHPNADKLSLCTVSTGTEDLQVICGAPNVERGQKVPFAPVGTVIPNGNFKIGKAKIRGVESYGMICAEDELGLSEDHSGIMVLDENLTEGTKLSDALKLNDVIMEIAITPNRPDALSHLGVARDLAAIYNKEMTIKEISYDESSEKAEDLASVEILDADNCPRYSSVIIKNVNIKESPEWLKKRLSSIGLRPINNVVDITNYVMYETGQPLHAFDLDTLKGNKIIVRSTGKEESFVTLDSKERKLPAGTLMICDAEKPVAVAGVMGGENSEIAYNTKNILIESAYFNPSSIRRTSKLLGLSTEASYRFERGIDPNGTVYAAKRTAQLIAELGGGEIAEGLIDVYPNKIEEPEVRLRFGRVTRILGYEIPSDKVTSIVKNLGFKIVFESNEELRLLVPTYRPDIEREIDIIEEIARIYGYDNVPAVAKISVTLGQKIDQSEFADKTRDVATGLGFFEMINNPLQSEKVASVTGNKIKVLNPQSLDMAYLRTSLIPGALTAVATNINYGEKDMRLFEVGHVFNKTGDGEIESFDDFTERQKLLFVLSGRASKKEWFSEEKPYNFYNLKGVVNSYISKISLDNVLNDSYYQGDDKIFDYKYIKTYKNSELGFGGKIKKEVLKQFDIQQEVYCFEFDLDGLKSLPINPMRYTEPLKYPKAERDFAFIFDKSVSYKEVVDTIKKSSSALLRNVEVFDLFESSTLGDDKKSMAFALEYYSEERTLKEEEVEKEFTSLIKIITKKFNAKLRGS